MKRQAEKRRTKPESFKRPTDDDRAMLKLVVGGDDAEMGGEATRQGGGSERKRLRCPQEVHCTHEAPVPQSGKCSAKERLDLERARRQALIATLFPAHIETDRRKQLVVEPAPAESFGFRHEDKVQCFPPKGAIEPGKTRTGYLIDIAFQRFQLARLKPWPTIKPSVGMTPLNRLT